MKFRKSDEVPIIPTKEEVFNNRVQNLLSIYNKRIDAVSASEFGEIFVISLDQKPERWKNAAKILGNLNMQANKFHAVDESYIKELGDKEVLINQEILSRYTHSLGSYGLLGCSISHMSLWAHLLDSKLPYLIIFEDDIMTYIDKKKIKEKLQTVLAKLPKNWDILYLGKCLDQCSNYEELYPGVYRTYKPYCFHSYIISNQGAKKLLEQPCVTISDSQTAERIVKGEVLAYTFHPSIFMQDVVKWNSTLRESKYYNNIVECANF